MTNDFFQAYVMTGFVTALSTLGLGLFVYLQKQKSAIHQAFLLLALSIFQWSFCAALQGLQQSLEAALFWGRVCHIGVLFIPVYFYYFSLKITSKSNDTLLRAGFVTAVILCGTMLLTPYFIPTERVDAGVKFIVSAGPLYSLIVGFFIFFVLASLRLFFLAIRHSSGVRKKHLEYFFWASVMGYGLWGINFFPPYGILIPPFPYSVACGTVYFWIIGFVILKHELFDIKVVIKKGLVFTILFVAIYGVVAGVIYALGKFVLSAAETAWLPLLSIALAMLIYEPLKRVLEQWTHRYLFQRKRQSVTIIQLLTECLREEVGTGRINFEAITSLISRELELKGCAYYRLMEGKLLRVAGWGGVAPLSRFGATHPLTFFAKNGKQPLVLRPISLEENTPLEKIMNQLDVEALIPVGSENEMSGILLVGAKKSEEACDHEDEEVLRFLQTELAMLLLSARLLRESVRSGLELSQRSKLSALRHLARGVHHEVRNPLHTMSLSASTTLEEIDKGYARRYSHEAWLATVQERVGSMSQEVLRIRETLNRFAQFARPGDERPRELLLADEIENFLALMREGQKLDSVDIQTVVHPGIKVMATGNLIQETLFSLFMNSLEAMKGTGRIELKAFAGSAETICVSIKDSGPGIPKHLLHKIFEPDFTTKADTGTVGFSLSAIKHRMELLGGRIEVQSVEGQGAEFILHFKPAV